MSIELRLLGWIDAGRHWPGLDSGAWVQLISMLDRLAPVPPRTVEKRFSGGPLRLEAPPTSAVVIVGGRSVGELCWSVTGPNEIVVRGDAVLVPPVAREVAAALRATFHSVPLAEEA